MVKLSENTIQKLSQPPERFNWRSAYYNVAGEAWDYLTTLPEGVEISTQQLVDRLVPPSVNTLALKRVYNALRSGMATELLATAFREEKSSGKGFNKGRVVTRRIWRNPSSETCIMCGQSIKAGNQDD